MTLMTVTEFGKRIRVARSTAYEIVAAGKVELTNIGTGKRPRLRVSEKALEQYIARNEVRAA